VKTKILTIVFVSCFGLSDEIHQAFVHERYASALDFVADCAGSIAGCLFYLNFADEKLLNLQKRFNMKI
jgi:VanZ family protein